MNPTPTHFGWSLMQRDESVQNRTAASHVSRSNVRGFSSVRSRIKVQTLRLVTGWGIRGCGLPVAGGLVMTVVSIHHRVRGWANMTQRDIGENNEQMYVESRN